MAQPRMPSPSPMSNTLAASMQQSTTRRLSGSPPAAVNQPQATLSKRDKRRTMIEQRLRDVTTSFSRDRDMHLRNQLSGISRDMHFVTRVDPYQLHLLDDGADALSVEIPPPPGQEVGERITLGRYAAGFVERVNNEMEGRDAQITDADMSFRTQIASMQLEYEFALQVADAESHGLKDMARQRVISTVQAKRRTIQKEKEQLDTADSTYLMNTHALTAFAPTPGSPSGVHASRKTRHTRNRQDPDSLVAEGDGAAGAGAGSADGRAAPLNGKRKRKAAGVSDLDYDSPGPLGGSGLRSTPFASAALWDKPQARGAGGGGEGDSVAVAGRFFTARELHAANKAAHVSVANAWTESRFRRPGAASETGPDRPGGSGAAGGGGGGGVGGDDSDPDPVPAMTLVAPAMDRGGGGSSHATRSTRLHHPLAPTGGPGMTTAAQGMAAAAAAGVAAAAAAAAGSGEGGALTLAQHLAHLPPASGPQALHAALEAWDDPRRVLGLAVLEAQQIRPPRGGASKDLEAPLTREMSAQQVQEDLAVLRSLMDLDD